MVAEIIDLSDPPPSSAGSSQNAARILNIDYVFIGKNKVEKVAIPLMACTYLWPVSGHTNEPSQIVTFQPIMEREATTVLEPVPESNTYLFPAGPRLKESLTHRQHDFVMEEGAGAKMLWNKTPQQVQSYAASFFRHLPSTYLHGFRKKKPTYYAAMAASVSYSIDMIVKEPQQTHMLFPDKGPCPSLLAPSYEEASCNNNTIMYGFQMQIGAANTSMNVVLMEKLIWNCAWVDAC
ncbi:hypothetical protein CR513_24177, partial [Mucuna pruriens]